MDKNWMKESIKSNLAAEYAKLPEHATIHEFWTALSGAVMEVLTPAWEESREQYHSERQAHYFSAEFLVGRSLLNNLINLDIYDDVKEIVEEYGKDLTEVLEAEIDPGLGNGGLGRLAACFLDSCATQNLPVRGYGILYRYGLLKQEFQDGFQKEYPDAWMEERYPFNVRCSEDRCLVHYDDMDVYAVPYDLPITGYGTDNVNVLRLWKPEPYQQFDFNLFNSQRFDDAVVQRNRVDDIYRVLYPNDTSYDGKVLRVRQQYFFVSASLQNILKHHGRIHNDNFDNFAEWHAIQLNDTHPVLAIPELMRLLMDEKGMSFDKAWAITSKTFAYTNHTILAEALEKWDIGIFQFLFPRILEIVRQIDEQFRREMQKRGLPSDQVEQLSMIHNGQVHMANLAVYASFSVNGVAEIHSGILKRKTLNGYYQIWPERFNNKTNGVTPRRWLRTCNPRLAALLTELLGSDDWVTDLTQLKKLLPYKDDEKVLRRLLDIKYENKKDLAEYIKRHEGVEIDPNSVFDVQIKRIHEYKRQLLNAFTILDQYYKLKADPKLRSTATPVTYIFGGKSAPGYFRAKGIIKFINEIAEMVNNDVETNNLLKVVFVQNYNVTYAEQIFPASDISEQISTVGKEASGTGNMKFMMNGALTLGTYDGANLEIVEAVGEDNSFMFGTKLKDMPATLDFYNSQWQYENVPGLKRVVDTLIDGTLSDDGTNMFRDIYQGLVAGNAWDKADVYYVLGDFTDYSKRKREAHEAYKDELKWAEMCWINICESGRFSSDRTIAQYASDIWNVEENIINK